MSSPPPKACGPLPSTSWTLIERAAQGEPAALTELLEQYREPMLAHLLVRAGWPRQDAEDALQGFIADKIVARDLLGAVRQQRGKFRNYLLTALDNYARDLRSYAQARCRHPQEARPVSLEKVGDVADGAPPPSPEFDVAWARQLILQSLEQMQAECQATDQMRVYEVFKGRVLDPLFEGTEPISYGKLLEAFAFASPIQAANTLITAKRMFERHLRGLIRQYNGKDCDVEAEIRELLEVLHHAGA